MPKHLDIKMRKKIIELHKQGLSTRAIGRELKISKVTAWLWIKRQDSLETKPRRGRRRKTTKEMDRLIYESILQNPFLPATKLANQLDLCKGVVRNRLKAMNFQSHVISKVQNLSDADKQKRYQFALKYQHWTKTDWKKVIFTGEKRFSAFPYGPLRVWTPVRKEADSEFDVQFEAPDNFSVFVWGCISNYGADFLHFITETTYNTDYYIRNILEQHLPENGDNELILAYNETAVNSVEDVANWFESHCIQTLILPPKSPDLNPLEDLWSKLKQLPITSRPKNSDDLQELLQNAFLSENEKEIQKLICTMPQRIQCVIAAKGDHTTYSVKRPK